MRFYIAQGVGFIGMGLLFLSYQRNEKRQILLAQACSGVFFFIHFLLLGAATGAAMNVAGIARNLVFNKKWTRKGQAGWVVFFSLLFTAAGILTWQGTMSILPIIAMPLSNVVLSMTKPRYIRFCILPVSGLWLVYNISTFSVAGAAAEVFALSSILIAVYRFDILKREEKK